jgi:hypothetical protein
MNAETSLRGWEDDDYIANVRKLKEFATRGRSNIKKDQVKEIDTQDIRKSNERLSEERDRKRASSSKSCRDIFM